MMKMKKNNYPEYAEVNGRRYKINTDFRYAIECDRIARDDTIGDYERALAIICTLFGEEGLNVPEDYNKLSEVAKTYLLCGKEKKEADNKEPDMDYEQDMDLIEASFMSDYRIDLSNKKMHWWKFYKLMNGLSNSEFGNCCILNRVRNLRNLNLNDIKDPKTKEEIRKQKEQWSLKRKEKEHDFTENEIENMNEFENLIGL